MRSPEYTTIYVREGHQLCSSLPLVWKIMGQSKRNFHIGEGLWTQSSLLFTSFFWITNQIILRGFCICFWGKHVVSYGKNIISDKRKVVIIIFSSALDEKDSSENKYFLLFPSGFWGFLLVFLGVGEVFQVSVFYILVTHFGDKWWYIWTALDILRSTGRYCLLEMLLMGSKSHRSVAPLGCHPRCHPCTQTQASWSSPQPGTMPSGWSLFHPPPRGSLCDSSGIRAAPTVIYVHQKPWACWKIILLLLLF